MRKTTRAKRPAKRAMKAAKRVLNKQKAAKAKKNMDTYFQRCRTEATLVPSQGLTVSNYIYAYWSLLAPGANSLYDNAQFQQNALIFDKFRVNRVKVSFTPKANVMDAIWANADATLKLHGSGVVHTAIDRDGAAPSSVSQIVQMPSYRRASALKKFSRAYSVSYPTGTWLDCQSYRAQGGGYAEVAGSLGLNGGVTLYCEDLPEDIDEIFNEPWAEIVVEWDVVFQGRNPPKTAFQLDASGNVIGYTITPNDPAENKAFSLSASKRGTIQDTRLTETVASNNEEDITHGADQ